MPRAAVVALLALLLSACAPSHVRYRRFLSDSAADCQPSGIAGQSPSGDPGGASWTARSISDPWYAGPCTHSSFPNLYYDTRGCDWLSTSDCED